jgi:tetratricopeptide (TPR) repeat protein
MAFAAALLASGCGTGRVETPGDAHAMVDEADVLLNNQGRVMQARRDLDAAMPILEHNDDKVWLGRAYRLYGLLALYGEDTILNLDVGGSVHPTAAQLDLSDQYLLRTLPLIEGAGLDFEASNINFLLGRNEELRGRPERSCAYYDRAIALYDKGKAALPDAVPETAKGYTGTARDGFVDMKKRAGCGAG